MSRGVAGGASTPNHATASKSRTPASDSEGTSGNKGWRFRLETASGRSLPDLKCGIRATMLSNITWICPPMRSRCAADEPL